MVALAALSSYTSSRSPFWPCENSRAPKVASGQGADSRAGRLADVLLAVRAGAGHEPQGVEGGQRVGV